MSEQWAASGSAAFTHLGHEVRAALSGRGFSTPTAPQREALAPLAAGENALVIAPTGTGKTETAMLPVFDSIAQADDRFGISTLYITPLRALNRDMRERLDWWGEVLDIEVPLADLPAQAEEWEQAVTEMTTEDEEIAEYVQSLEERGDAEVDMTEALGKIDGDALAAEFERYLRRRGPGYRG